MDITLPARCLVVLIGPSSSGKSTLAHRFFPATAIISSDACRAMLCDDESEQRVSREAFELLYFILQKRLQLGHLTVVDATSLRSFERAKLLSFADQMRVPAIAWVLDTPLETLLERHAARTDRNFHAEVIKKHYARFQQAKQDIIDESFSKIYTFPPSAIDTIHIEIMSIYKNYNTKKGPFDIIGDVHGCYDELCLLLHKLGYEIEAQADNPLAHHVHAPHGRTLLFVGDLVDRGPASERVLALVMELVAQKIAYCVSGNHDDKLRRKLLGNKVNVSHGLEDTLKQLRSCPSEFVERVLTFLNELPMYCTFDKGKLLLVHAGLPQRYHGKTHRAARAFSLYGQPTGKFTPEGLPTRYNWARDYQGDTLVVYGHSPVKEADWQGQTVDIDTGCVFGGKMTALRYPENTLMTQEALHTYAEKNRPLGQLKGLTHY